VVFKTLSPPHCRSRRRIGQGGSQRVEPLIVRVTGFARDGCPIMPSESFIVPRSSLSSLTRDVKVRFNLFDPKLKILRIRF